MLLRNRLVIILLCLIAGTVTTQAQVKLLKGIVLDKQSDEPIPYASVIFKKDGRGVLTDSSGRFMFQLNQWPAGDTLEISNVG